ncbi:hypothetical protein H4217_007944, partial [Coemansia sp. RSA 1939]
RQHHRLLCRPRWLRQRRPHAPAGQRRRQPPAPRIGPLDPALLEQRGCAQVVPRLFLRRQPSRRCRNVATRRCCRSPAARRRRAPGEVQVPLAPQGPAPSVQWLFWAVGLQRQEALERL